MTARIGTRLRRKVACRDHGICSLCGLDCGELDNDLMRLRWRDPAAWEAECAKLGRFGADRYRSTWHADHVVPLIDGGPDTLVNLRTLCWLCHIDITAQQARERAA